VARIPVYNAVVNRLGLLKVAARREQAPSKICGYKVTGMSAFDSTKLMFEDASWILSRQSNTEPTFRIYCEMTSLVKAMPMIVGACGWRWVELPFH
jgi:phosphomannomutase